MLRKLFIRAFISGIGLVAIACNVIQPQASRPSVVISSPPSGSVYTVGEQVVVQSTASDPARILRVELIVDGVSVRQDSTPIATGQEQFSLLQTWTADRAGQRNLIVRATNAQGVTSESGIYITVRDATQGSPTTSQPTGAATNAPTDVPTQTALPSPTTNAVVTVIVTATSGPTQAATSTVTPKVATATSSESASCTDNSTFVADVTIPDGTNFSPNAAFTKTWRVRNTGTCNWQNYQLVFASGAQLNGAASVPVPATAAGATADISVSMTAPATFGNYKGTWRLRNANGTFFGTSVTVLINVPNPNAAANATATNTTVPPTLPAASSCSGQPANFTFTASASTINAGQSVTLNWGAVNNASIAVLNGGQFNQQGVGAPGSITATPNATTTYTLTATCNNGGGTRSNSVTVTVSGAPANTATSTLQPISGCVNPKIGVFFGNPATITAGQEVTLSWSGVVGADFVQMDGLILQGVESGSVVRSPTTTTTFELVAVCRTTGQTAVRQVTITVTGGGGAACSGQPTISSFTASATTIQAGQSVTFNWGAVTNADQVIFDNPAPTGGGNVSAPGTITLSPTTNTTYNLVATCTLNGNFSARSITVTVNP